jgi:uncharacterized protein
MQSFPAYRAVAAALAAALAATAGAGSLTLDFTGVHSAQGRVMVSLCGDAAGRFPGGCTTLSGTAPAAEGQVSVRVENVPDGNYAVQAFHDENGNHTAEVPPEGYAFGNDAAWPPSFSAAAVKVSGDSRTSLRMNYIGGAAPAAATRQPSHGADAPAGVQRFDLREQGLYGELYVPAHAAAPAPGLLLIGGSEGGVDTISAMATSFALEGFAVLALAYWGEQGLPSTLEGIPLEYFDRAINWLQRQPQVAEGGIGMLGWSRGSEAALLTASRNRAVRAVVAVAPSGVVWQGLYYGSDRAPRPAWTVAGKPLPALLPDAAAYRANAPLSGMFVARFAALAATPAVQIRVERIRGGVLLISGGKDAIWPSTRFCDRIAARLQVVGFRGDYLHLDYPEAGHAVFVGHPDGPMARAIGAAHPAMGGSPAANIVAWNDSWPKTLDFLRTQLKGTRR